ncbi:MAG: cryptochrome/photolyase family protein, partial [Polyangiaceae bacterium]
MRSAELFFVGPWDLDRRLPCVPDDPDRGRIVFVESVAKGRALPYHRQKLVLVLSAMHHFADELQAEGFDVTIVNAATYVDGLRAQVEITGASRIHAMMPREWGVARSLVTAAADGYLGAELRLHDDGGDDAHFLLPRSAFAEWARGRKTLRMHHFYGWMRKRTGWLMEDGEPVGGKLSYDEKNRKPAKGLSPPDLLAHEPDELTTRIMERVSGWQGRWGSVDGFAWPVTRSAALEELDDFFARRAADFGPYQDAMLEGERFLWHARISAALNLGLLRP